MFDTLSTFESRIRHFYLVCYISLPLSTGIKHDYRVQADQCNTNPTYQYYNLQSNLTILKYLGIKQKGWKREHNYSFKEKLPANASIIFPNGGCVSKKKIRFR